MYQLSGVDVLTNAVDDIQSNNCIGAPNRKKSKLEYSPGPYTIKFVWYPKDVM